MASLITSSRNSAINVFDVVTNTSALAINTLDSANKGMDILHAKVRIAHAVSTQNLEEKISDARLQDLSNMNETHSKFILERETRLAKDPELKAIYDRVTAERTKR